MSQAAESGIDAKLVLLVVAVVGICLTLITAWSSHRKVCAHTYMLASVLGNQSVLADLIKPMPGGASGTLSGSSVGRRQRLDYKGQVHGSGANPLVNKHAPGSVGNTQSSGAFGSTSLIPQMPIENRRS